MLEREMVQQNPGISWTDIAGKNFAKMCRFGIAEQSFILIKIRQLRYISVVIHSLSLKQDILH